MMDPVYQTLVVTDVTMPGDPTCLKLSYGAISYFVTKTSRIIKSMGECRIIDEADALATKFKFPSTLVDLLLEYDCIYDTSDIPINIGIARIQGAQTYAFHLVRLQTCDFNHPANHQKDPIDPPTVVEIANCMLSAIWEHINSVICKDREHYFQSLVQSATILSADLPNIPYPNSSFSYEENSAISDLIGHLEKLADYAVDHRESCKLPGTAFAFRNIISYMRG